MKKIYSFLVLMTACILQADAQQLQTVNGTFDLSKLHSSEGITSFLQSHGQVLRKQYGATGGNDYIILSFPHILSQQEKDAVEAQGLRLLYWLPDNAYIAACTDVVKSLKGLQLLSPLLPDGIGEVPAALKLTKDLYSYVAQGKEVPADVRPHGLAISVYERNDLPLLEAFAKNKKLTVRKEKYSSDLTLVITGKAAKYIGELATLVYVSSIEPYQGAPTEEWSFKMFANQTYAVNYNVGAIGNGTYFGNYETYGADTLYDFNMKGRQHPTLSDNSVNDHGTNCAEIVGAANNRDEYEDRGMAPGVTAMYLDWYNRVENNYNNNNIRPLTSNHSVGWTAGQVTYNNDSRELDRITRLLGGYIHSYSAGNNGTSGPFNGYPAGWANLTGAIKVNKNNFTTHSAAAPGLHHTWTNNGPAADGRLKPDICAEGGEGSSYASPGVMGLVNILYETYTTTYGTFPRSDVAKAVILNTAIDLDKKGIDFKTGFGVINPIRATRAIQQQHIFTGTMPAGSTGSASYTLNIPAGLREGKILLYWHDFPGTVGAAKALVNDLDLIVLSPAGDTIRPWCLMPTPATVYNLPTRRLDTLNNVEQVTLDNPVAGTYTILVKGSRVPQGPQLFVVTYDLLPYHIEITNPVAGFRVARGKRLYFTWNLANNQTNTADSIQVFLQRTAAEAFTQIASLPNNSLYYEYVVPTAFPFSATSRIVVRQKNTSLADTSKPFQVMATPSNLQFTRICSDTVALKWDTLNNTGGKYIIYRLGAKYMEAVDSVLHPANTCKLSATRLLGVGGQWVDGEWFAVTARHANGALGLRSLPVTQQLSNPLNPPGIGQVYSHLLCYGDTATLSTGVLTGDSIRWFRNNLPVAGATGPSLKRTAADAGVYYFEIYNSACTYRSNNYVVASGNANINDTVTWGNYNWLVSAYEGVGHTSVPYYGARPRYYGKFQVNDLSFNSNDYYAWSGTGPHNASGYTGCAFTAAATTTTVWKRKGFVPGIYRINVLRASGRMNVTVNNGVASTYTSPVNAYTVSNIWTGLLDSNSTIRVEHYGSHARIELEPLRVIAPGNVSNGLAVWTKAAMSLGTSTDKHTLINAVPRGGAAEKQTGAAISLVAGGLNFNPVLIFNGTGGFQGQFPDVADSVYRGTAVSSFGIFNIATQSVSGSRILSFAGNSTLDNNVVTSFIPFTKNTAGNAIVSQRNITTLGTADLSAGKWLMMTSKFNTNLHTVSQNGALSNSATYNATAFNLKRYAVGSSVTSLVGYTTGSIAELVHYNRALSTLEEQQVNTYLAIKYGVTLNHNYISTTGQVVYDMSGAYNRQIAGIGSEQTEGLLQKQSRSQEAGGDLFTGSLAAIQQSNAGNTQSFLADTVYSIWGHNGADTLFRTPYGTTGNQTRMSRIWKLQKTGRVGTMRFNFNATALPAAAGTIYYLATSNDPAFSSQNVTLTTLATYTGADNINYAYADRGLIVVGNETLYFTVVKQQIANSVPAISNALTRVIVDPVPASQQITITNTDITLNGQAVTVFDVQGKVVWRFIMQAAQTLDVSAWAAGIYHLKLPDNKVVKIEKL
jgi:hypothetical protein